MVLTRKEREARKKLRAERGGTLSKKGHNHASRSGF